MLRQFVATIVDLLVLPCLNSRCYTIANNDNFINLTFSNHFQLWIRNQDIKCMLPFLETNKAIITGGAIIKLINGNIGRQVDGDIDMYFPTSIYDVHALKEYLNESFKEQSSDACAYFKRDLFEAVTSIAYTQPHSFTFLHLWWTL